MCGISGFLTPPGRRVGFDREAALDRVTGLLSHRGPDAGGTWSDPERGVFLGHRRLSILDLSEAGSQPMVSRSGRLVVTYNGEIYNFRELAARLGAEGISLRSTSDTEVLIESIERFGLEETLRAAAGMFAFALWDRRAETLTLARDRVGIKPLYHGMAGEIFVFGSELTALASIPGFRHDVAEEAARAFFQLGYVPAPLTIFDDARKLPPGTYLTVKPGHGASAREARWWSLREIASSRPARARGTFEDAERELESLLLEVTSQTMVSDVPVGCFLSGGVDSAAVATFAARSGARLAAAFCVGFDRPEYDETESAREMAGKLGIPFFMERLTGAEAASLARESIRLYDEPFADSSQVPTLFVSRLAAARFKVVLSGDGGDEVFGGYRRYLRGGVIHHLLKRRGAWKRALASALRALDVAERKSWHALLPRSVRGQHFARRVHRALGLLGADGEVATFLALVGTVSAPDTGETADVFTRAVRELPDTLSFEERLLLFDSLIGLPDDMLYKVDRASMSRSLEVRVPLADHRLFELVWRWPLSFRIEGAVGKRILRSVLARQGVTRAPSSRKMGFSMPLGDWLRGPLREWAADTISSRVLHCERFVEPTKVRSWWAGFLEGRASHEALIWSVLCFEEWAASRRTEALTAPARDAASF